MIPITLTDLHMYLMGCECSDKLFTSGEEVVKLLKELVERSGLECLKHQYHDFSGCGTTAVVLLAESHVAIHTWPETNKLVVVDIGVEERTVDGQAIIQPRRFHANFKRTGDFLLVLVVDLKICIDCCTG